MIKNYIISISVLVISSNRIFASDATVQHETFRVNNAAASTVPVINLTSTVTHANNVSVTNVASAPTNAASLSSNLFTASAFPFMISVDRITHQNNPALSGSVSLDNQNRISATLPYSSGALAALTDTQVKLESSKGSLECRFGEIATGIVTGFILCRAFERMSWTQLGTVATAAGIVYKFGLPALQQASNLSANRAAANVGTAMTSSVVAPAVNAAAGTAIAADRR